MTVYVVHCGPIILGVYARSDIAHIHMRAMTGATVVPVHVRETLPQDVLDGMREEFEDDDPTPVTRPFTKGGK